MSGLDRVLPDFAHRTRHAIVVDATPAAAWDAIREVTPAELPVTRLLTGIRSLASSLTGSGGSRRASDTGRPVIEQFLAAGFTVVHDDAPRSIVAGAVSAPWRLGRDPRPRVEGPEAFATFAEPGYVRMALAFDLEPDGARTRITTETRVQPTDPEAARAFRRYWTAIRLGSELIRLELGRAIKRRAESPPPPAT
jgi:hypothetical protein